MNDPAETLVTESLTRHAEEAPPDETLLGSVHRRLRRRRRVRSAGVGVLACAAVVVAGVGLRSVVQPQDVGPVAQPAAGWHWESYANVELQAPDGWKDIGAGPRATCPSTKAAMNGWVGRPSMLASPAIGCPVAVAGSSVVLPELAYRVPYVLFSSDETPGVKQYDAGWTREVRAIGGVKIEVFGPDAAVRERVFASARTIDGVDSRGCAPSHSAATDQRVRPKGGGLADVGAVRSIAVCAYRLGPGTAVPPLLASAELTGDQAREVGAALTTAPALGSKALTTTGDHPVSVRQCPQGATPEVLVLRVHGDRGAQEVVVRLAGCGPFDTDDGTTFRNLTKESVGPLLETVGRPEVRGLFLTNLLK
ncbi:hypothetical protein [Kribbella sp. NPDC051770]|uniref:hypothetical protein n=1 Tax=Kribbella sp. NPDC051770 TaxID=3155413 RepID=UPI00342B8AE6